MKKLFFIAFLLYFICVTFVDKTNELLSSEEKANYRWSEISKNIRNIDLQNMEESYRNRHVLQDFKDVYEKYSRDVIQPKDDWRDKMVNVWDWFVNGIKSVTDNMKSFTSQIIGT